MAINKAQGTAIKSLMREAGWEVVLAILAARIETINAEEIVGNSEFETLRMLHKNQGKVAGLKEFFDILERGAFDEA